ncbi:MAG: hypothetical protein NZ839_00180, partial [Endomicrobia bacterium]|nr:hypothetical protein [Endomicrobiia bacterium]
FQRQQSDKSKQLVQLSQSQINSNTKPYETEILYAIVSDQLKEFSEKISKLHQMLGIVAKTEIINEIEAMKQQIQKIEQSINKLKTEDETKKIELRQQILTTLEFFSHIKQLLQIDFENLLSQRDKLKKILRQQEIEYEHTVNSYNNEIKKLTEMIEELKNSYPEELLSKLKYEVVDKTRILEKIQNQYNELKTDTTDKINFLDQILTQKSAQIQQFIVEIKTENEQEILNLKNNIEELKQQTTKLDEEIKSIITNIHQQQQQKTKIIQQLNTELESLKHRQFEIASLKTREEFLKTEIEKLNKEYNELQQEYKQLSYKKAENIRELQHFTEQKIAQLIAEWEEKKKEYNLEIQKLKRRLDVLLKRKEKILKIQKTLTGKILLEQKSYEQKVLKAKLELEQKRSQLETLLKSNIVNLEITYQTVKQKVDQLKEKLKEKIQKYNDIIAELKKRSTIREQRIQKDIEKAKLDYENMILTLQEKVEYAKQDTLNTSQQVVSKREELERKTLAGKERLETFQQLIEEVLEKINIAKNELGSFEAEIATIEQQIVNKFDEIITKITTQKQQVINKLEKLLEEQDEVLLKIIEKSKENEKIEK